MLAATAEFAAQLTAFMAARHAMPDALWFNDEMDLWAAFVMGALHIEDSESLISGHRALLAGGCDTAVAAPQLMRMTNSQRRRLRALHRDRPSDWLKEAEALIAEVQVGRDPNWGVPGRVTTPA
jgi:hypothetical protein